MTSVLTQTLQDIRITGDPAPVFRTREGKPYRFSLLFQLPSVELGAPISHFMSLRHTFASRWVMRGVDLATVKELMGHKHIHMTLHYAHLAPGHKRSAIAVLDRIEEKPHQFSQQARIGF